MNMRKTPLRSYINSKCKTTVVLHVLLMTVLLLVLMIATAHSMLVSTTNQKRVATSSSLMIEEVEDRPRWSSTGIEPGGLWLASQDLAY